MNKFSTWLWRTAFWLRYKVGYGLKVYGRDNFPMEGPVIVVPNHLSNNDPPICGYALPRHVHFMAKQELFVNPISRFFCTWLGAFPLNRGAIDKIAIQYPAILKPSDAQGQRGIFLIRSQSEFESHFQDVVKYSREGKVIVEKYIEGPEVSVNGYMVNGVMRFLIVSDRDTWPEYTGLIHKHIVPSKAVCNTANSKIKRIVEDACNRIGILNGPF